MIEGTVGQNEPLVCYRVISPAYAGTPLSGMGAARRGGRFNRPGQEALYLTMDEVTALAEYRQDNPWLPPGTICTFFVQGLHVADLAAGFDAEHWPPLWADFAMDWRAEWFGKSIEPPTWYVALDATPAQSPPPRPPPPPPFHLRPHVTLHLRRRRGMKLYPLRGMPALQIRIGCRGIHGADARAIRRGGRKLHDIREW